MNFSNFGEFHSASDSVDRPSFKSLIQTDEILPKVHLAVKIKRLSNKDVRSCLKRTVSIRYPPRLLFFIVPIRIPYGLYCYGPATGRYKTAVHRVERLLDE